MEEGSATSTPQSNTREPAPNPTSSPTTEVSDDRSNKVGSERKQLPNFVQFLSLVIPRGSYFFKFTLNYRFLQLLNCCSVKVLLVLFEVYL